MNTRIRRHIERALLAAALLAGTTAHAQYSFINPGSFTNMYAVNGAQLAQNLQFAARMKELRRIEETTRPGAAPAVREAGSVPAANATPKAPLTASDFKPTGTRDAPQRLAAQIPDPQTRAQVIDLGRQIVGAIEQTPGFRRHNLAYAMTIFLGGSLQVLSGREFSDEQSQALAQWINDEMAAAGAVTQLGARERTQLYDVLLLQGGLTLAIAQAGAESGNAEYVRIAKTMARDALATFGITP